MPEVQSAYTDRQPIGIVGMKVNAEEYNAITRLAEGAAIAFGQPVARGTADNQCVLFDGANDFLGISVRDVSVRPSAGDQYPVGGNVTVLTSGSIWVRVTGAVTAGDAANYDGGDDRFSAAAVAGDVVALPAGWFFDSSAADGGLAILARRA